MDAIEILQFEVEQEVSEDWLTELVDPRSHPNHTCRISFYREGDGKYAPINNYYKTFIEREDCIKEFWIPTALDLRTELKNAPKNIGKIEVYPMPKPDHPLYTIKTLSSAYYVLAAKYKVENGIDHLLLINDLAQIIEELSSNILLVKDDEVYIPRYENGAVKGSCLRYIKAQYGFQLKEVDLTLNDLSLFDEIYLSKGTTGIYRIK